MRREHNRNQLTSFVGRTTELNEVAQRLRDPGCRLLTLLGPGGTGKSRLVQELVRREAGEFTDGVYWVNLEPVRTEQSLITAIAAALFLPLPDQSSARERLLTFLEDKKLLLVLDNFEQLVEDATILDELLRRGEALQLLVTSRIALHLEEEWLYPLSGLPYPAGSGEGKAWSELEQYDAVRLFVERVCQMRPDFSPQDEREGLLRICQLVEGMPLALELAAPWSRILSCAEIAAEIERNQSFLSTPIRNVPQRQRSMQAVFNHSWSLLDAAEQRVFRRLAVFRGGFDRSAAEAVAGTADGGTVLGQLSALVDKSLLRREEGRYQMHGLLRQYAEQQLARSAAEVAGARHRHSVYYLDFLAQREATLLGGGQREAADNVALELENIRAAWQWAVERQMWGAITSAVEALAMFFHIKGRYLEASSVYEEALSHLDVVRAEPGAALLLCEAGWIAIRLGRFQKAEALYEQCQNVYERFGLEPLRGQGTDPLLGLSTLASIAGKYEKARALAQEAWQRATEQEHWHNLQTANYQLASIAYAQGEYEAAQSYAEAAYDVCQQTGDRWFMGYCLSELGRAERALGDLEGARRHFEASYELRESFSDPEGMALALNNLGEVALRQGQNDEARTLFERSERVYKRIGDRGGWAAARGGLARAALAERRYEEARELFREALEVAATILYTPLLLSTLAAIAAFLVETGREDAGAGLMTLVWEHPATDQETRSLVQAQLKQMDIAGGDASVVATERSAPDLATAVATVQRELSVTVPFTSPAPSPVASSPLVEPLTERELEVLQLLAEGLTNREIAERLVVVTGTVKAHNNHIFGKLGVRNRTEAVMRARELGLL